MCTIVQHSLGASESQDLNPIRTLGKKIVYKLITTQNIQLIHLMQTCVNKLTKGFCTLLSVCCCFFHFLLSFLELLIPLQVDCWHPARQIDILEVLLFFQVRLMHPVMVQKKPHLVQWFLLARLHNRRNHSAICVQEDPGGLAELVSIWVHLYWTN